MLERAETNDRLYLVKFLVSLFSRPILPSYNKGKNTILSCQFIFQIYWFMRLRRNLLQT